jgi:catechol 2,3-dioxygenase-like lactoylglutathione lyase family enzyme
VSPSPLIGILHAVVITRDMERALAYYRDLLGFAVASRAGHDPTPIARLGGPAGTVAEAAILNAPDGSELEIACFREPAGKSVTEAGWTDAGIRSITFTVSDIAAMLARLAAAGYPAVGETVRFLLDGGPVLVAYVAAPDGVVLTLFQRESAP